ncbi:hypothetical protein QYF61_014914 [Mycteria americana]|uniref:Uncharacterized protein n=1 Tax=Mycteria americana TaxID=33587 RepID=A0AAN7NU62_MYCAM|nr:hypothetical protein QYF61_014914 [Mycteria americana]
MPLDLSPKYEQLHKRDRPPPLYNLLQGVVESDKVSPQPPFLQAKQPQLPQPLLRRLLLQTLHQLRCPSLDTLQHLHVSLVVGGPKLNTVFEVRPHQCPVQGDDHFPSPAGHMIPHTSQDAIGLLGHLGTLLAHIQPAVHQHSQVLFRWAAFQPLSPKPVALHGVVVTQVQDLALGLVKPHTTGLGPSIQPVQSLPTLKQINTPAQLGVICKLAEGALDPLIQIIDKDIKQNCPQHRALENTPCDRPPTGVNSIHHHSLGPAIQTVFYPVKSTPVQAMSSQFLQENAVGNGVKGFTKSRLSVAHACRQPTGERLTLAVSFLAQVHSLKIHHRAEARDTVTDVDAAFKETGVEGPWAAALNHRLTLLRQGSSAQRLLHLSDLCTRDLRSAGVHQHSQDGAQPPAHPGGLRRQSTLVVVLWLQLREALGKGAKPAVTMTAPQQTKGDRGIECGSHRLHHSVFFVTFLVLQRKQTNADPPRITTAKCSSPVTGWSSSPGDFHV